MTKYEQQLVDWSMEIYEASQKILKERGFTEGQKLEGEDKEINLMGAKAFQIWYALSNKFYEGDKDGR